MFLCLFTEFENNKDIFAQLCVHTIGYYHYVRYQTVIHLLLQCKPVFMCGFVIFLHVIVSGECRSGEDYNEPIKLVFF